MKNIFVFLSMLLILSGCDDINNINNNEDMPKECITQENLRKSFTQMKEIILKNGKEETLYEGYTHTTYTYSDIDFSYRISGTEKNELEQITISDKENNTFYWLLGRNNEYHIETKDYSENIGKQKYEEAKNHFCNIILNLEQF